MPLSTAFTETFNVTHPVVLAPMVGSAGGALAAAVSNAGGFGLVGGGRGEREWLDRELPIVAEGTREPWGVGFLAWAAEVDVVARALEHQPAAVMLSFGDPGPFADRVRAAGVRLIVQVTDLDEARRAADAGADVIVAQGTEAGGHGGARATFPFVPAAVDHVAPTPVLAAGGIADGRGLAAALALGAAGALLGTRFLTSLEAIVSADIAKAILESTGEDTERTRIPDIASGVQWPHRYTGRALRNAFLDRWRDREEELRDDRAAQERYRAAMNRGDLTTAPVWASEAIDLIGEVSSAADIVTSLVVEAEKALARAGNGRA
jgi:nitronate monooxygenase